jgi:hypothetical protein
MALNKGLKGIKEYRERQEKKKVEAAADRLPWFSFPDKVKVSFRPLQEFSDESPNYSEKNGLVGMAVLHSHPDDFRKSAECTMAEEEACRGCEQYRDLFPEGKGWKAYTKVFMNGLVKEADGTLRHVLVGASRQLENALVDYAEEEDGVTDRWWRVTRDEKTYTISPGGPDTSVNPEDYEMIDLERAYKHIPYEEQDAFYGLLAEKPEESNGSEEAPAAATAASDDSW